MIDRYRPSPSRRVLVGLTLTFALSLGGCASIPPPSSAQSSAAALALFERTAAAHGKTAFEAVEDISVAYDGEWYALVQKLQAVLVDPDYRKRSEERVLIDEGVVAQVHTGPAGQKYVLRLRDHADADAERLVEVRYDGEPSDDATVLDAAALVADAYRLFLLGPLHFVGTDAQFEILSDVSLNGRRTQRLRVRTQPGLGAAERDDYVLYIDARSALLSRVRFTLEGLASTRGAVVETDLFDYIERGGVQFPTRFFERIRRPIPGLRAHRWRMTGLDLNRGLDIEDVMEGAYSGAAAAPAAALPDR